MDQNALDKEWNTGKTIDIYVYEYRLPHLGPLMLTTISHVEMIDAT